MRNRLLAIAVTALLAGSQTVVKAQLDSGLPPVLKKQKCDKTQVGTSVGCLGDLLTDAVNGLAGVVSPPVSSSPSVPSVKYKSITVPKVWAGSDGGPCVKMIEISVPEDYEVPAGGGVPERISVCPDNLLGEPPVTTGPGGASPIETRRGLATRYWKDTPLPTPDPYIAPGRAITGLFAYLETRGTTSQTYTEPDTPFGPLTVTAIGKYYVDWGDGTHIGPHSSEGEPWPDGQIKHQYINVGAYDVVLTERWTAVWSFGDESGTLDELRTAGRIDDFPVQQIQAVVLR